MHGEDEPSLCAIKHFINLHLHCLSNVDKHVMCVGDEQIDIIMRDEHVDNVSLSIVPRPSMGGKGRPGTHCMRMREHPPYFGESMYAWILSDTYTINNYSYSNLRCP